MKIFDSRIQIEKELSEQFEAQKTQALAKMAAQVAHDIRSPLAALKMVLATLNNISEDRRLIIRNATNRISDITFDLIASYPLPSSSDNTIDATEALMIVGLLEAIVSEKRVQYRERMEVEIQAELQEGYGLFTQAQASDVLREISSAIDSAVEDLHGAGTLTLSVKADTNSFDVTLNNGDLFTLTLPRAPAPTWFLQSLALAPGLTIVSVDDDQTIHQIWKGRFASILSHQADIEHVSFTSLEQFEAWAGKQPQTPTRYLVDYEFLNQNGNGLDSVERLGIGPQTILVTSRFEENLVKQRARALGVRILPKGLLSHLPLSIEKAKTVFDAVLIDDDSLVHMTWKLVAKEKNKSLVCFFNLEDFLKGSDSIAPQTPIFIDVSLANGIRGEKVAEDLAKLGFSNIALATGYDPATLKIPPCVKRVVGKDPQF